MSRTRWTWARLLGGAAILAVLVWRLGAGPFVDGVHSVDGWSLAAASGIAVLTTVCCAWRWSLIARGLGAALPLRAAVPAYYRSQFLNAALPGGVLGDVHRAVRHGRAVGDLSRALRAVAWERSAGQVVQVLLAVLVLLLMPSPVRAHMPVVAVAAGAGVLGLALLGRGQPRGGGSSLRARTVRTASTDLREALLTRRAWPGIVLASVLVVVGHAVTFLIAARAAGAVASTVRMLPLAVLVLLAAGLPTNIAGWGPREGVAAWVFGVAGLGAAQGVATAVVYGVMVLVASLPGAVVLLVSLYRDPRARDVEEPRRWRPTATACPEGAAGG